VFIRPGHCAGLNATLKTVSDHKVRTSGQGGEKRRDAPQVVTAVAVTYHNQRAARRFDAASHRVAVALCAAVDHSRSGLLGDLGRTVGGTVVAHDDLSGHASHRQAGIRFGNARANGSLFIEARDNDGDERGFRRSRYAGAFVPFRFNRAGHD
jgi:hypothetical protein